jgi:hypothetical protein
MGTLNAAAIKHVSGDVPQNVDYAIKSQYLVPGLGATRPTSTTRAKLPRRTSFNR